MQIRQLLFRCASVLSIASTIVLGAQSSQAQVSSNYSCGTSDGAPTTIYKSPGEEDIPLIRWTTTLGEQWTPKVRCQVVSQRFDRFDRDGTLEFLTTGRVNKMPVVCAVPTEGAECSDQYNSDRVLFTLPEDKDPDLALEQLLGFASVVENGDPRSYYNGRTYINISRWMLRNRRIYK
ncbi:MAG: hypothetical protein F6K54_37850 [Okeania sp. SIO3B5]|uniref:COP23 domain-containing protein n=1 Tax=Okeania sp. SIO3B5 TaxID=2607811 RepID=UPI0013FFC2DA|nr:COP23 domain-containing protein [Okeania sp. SIO3B5]NEO58310.1 hypothetical protein [Okeania sp. SIO3B5]